MALFRMEKCRYKIYLIYILQVVSHSPNLVAKFPSLSTLIETLKTQAHIRDHTLGGKITNHKNETSLSFSSMSIKILRHLGYKRKLSCFENMETEKRIRGIPELRQMFNINLSTLAK